MSEMDYEDPSQPNMFCNSCKHPIASFTERMQHYKTEWHRYNVKRRCANLEPLTEDVFNMKVNLIQQRKEEITSKFSCVCCDKSFGNESAYDQHLISKKHMKKAAYFDKKQAEAEAEEDTPMGDADGAAATATGENDIEVEEEEEEEEVEVKEPIPVGNCLFCPVKLNSVDKCVNHMLKKHGFFIPYIELLHDLEGLLEYLGYKIGVGHVCIYCNGRGRAAYGSLEAVRAHMEAKCHCKIRFEEDAEDIEFLEFYNFPGTVRIGPDGEEIVDEDDGEGEEVDDDGEGEDMEVEDGKEKEKESQGSKRHVVDMNDAGELVLSDGAVIGHRSLNTVYKQKLKPYSPYENIINTMLSEYRALKLPGYQKAAMNKSAPRWVYARKNKERMQLGVKHNKFQTYFRAQVNF